MNYKDQTLGEVLASIASENIAPAGGSSAAVVGAIGAALCEMVCIHTIENDEDAAKATELADLQDNLRRQRTHLLQLAETDARIIDEFFSGSNGVLEQRDLKRSVGVPLTIADACLNVLKLTTEVTERSTRTAVIDAGTSVFLVQGALRASVFTVRSNLEQMSNTSFINKIEQDVGEIEKDSEKAYEQAMENINK